MPREVTRAGRVVDAREVRERERYYLDLGINAVPSVIINERQLIRGAQTAEVFAQALRNAAVAQ